MAPRQLRITVVSAQDLPDVRLLGKMKVYAKVLVEGEPKTTKKTPVDYGGKTNPRWNFVVDYTVSESTIRRYGVNVVVQLWCKRTLGDRFIGDVRIPVRSLFNTEATGRYEVAGTPEGTLDLLYSFSGGRGRMLSGWKTALGSLVLVAGVMLLLGGESDHDYDHDHHHHHQPKASRWRRFLLHSLILFLIAIIFWMGMKKKTIEENVLFICIDCYV